MVANTTLEPADSASLPFPRWQVWTGRVLSAMPALMLAMSASMKLSHNPGMVEAFTSKFGYPAGVMTVLGTLELACTVLYLVPQTAVLGAVLLTGYLGGAIATHVRVTDAFAVPLLLAVLLWVGLFLRDPRVRGLLPMRKAGGRA
jgi:hypothetical protein